MRIESAFSIKRRMRGKKSTPAQRLPRPGSNIRRIYDHLMSNKGVDVSLTTFSKDPGTVVMQLRDFWGLDIRKFSLRTYRLVGEYCGKIYIDYSKEAEAQAKDYNPPTTT